MFQVASLQMFMEAKLDINIFMKMCCPKKFRNVIKVYSIFQNHGTISFVGAA